MNKEIPLSYSIFVSKFFFNAKKNLEIAILLIFTFGIFSNSVSAQGLPLQDFSSGIPNTWTIAASPATPANNSVPTTATGGYLSTPGAMVNPALNSTVGTKAEYFLITPQFNAANVTEVRFFTKQGSFQDKGTIYQLRLSTAVQPNINNFVVLQSWTEATLSAPATTYQEKIVTLPEIPANTPIYLAFVAIVPETAPANAGDIWFIDNVRVIESCPQVKEINSTMAANGGVINWAHPSTTKFEIQIVEKSQAIVPKGTEIDGLSYTATGLKNGTDYDIYLKTICDGTTASAWTGPFPVKTSRSGLTCATPKVIPGNTSVNPYVLSANLNTFYDNQTYTPLDSKGLSCHPFGSNNNWLAGDHAFLSYTPTVSGLVNVGLAVDTSGGANGCFNSVSSVFVFDSCAGIGTTANCLGSLVTGQPSNVTSAQLPNVYLEAGKTYYFVISSPFQHTATATQTASICFTFTLSQPSCPIPSEITYDNLLHASAKFSWTNPQNLVSSWEYIAKPASQGAPIGSDVLKSTSININNAVSGLNPNTGYNLYVRSVCSGTPGAWSSPMSFRTLCNVFSTPFATNFAGESAANPQPCWTPLDLNNDGTTFTFPISEVVRLRTSSISMDIQTNDMLASPQVHLDGITQKRLRFKFKGYSGITGPAGFVLGESSFAVKLSTTGVGPNNFTTEILPIATYQTGDNWVEKVISIPANVVGDVSIAWVLPPGYPNTAIYFSLNDVFIEDLPACSEPQSPGVTAGSIIANSAQFYWTNGYNNSKWEIKVQPLNSGVPTTDGVVVDTNPFTMTGLTSPTQYEYYIRAYCTATSKSVWVGPVAFNTLCEVQSIPYYESMNDADPTNKKSCWSVYNKNGDMNSTWVIEGAQATIKPQDLFMNPFASYDDYLISPQVNVTGQKMLKFKYKVASTILVPGQRGNLEVLMSSTPNFANATVLIPSHDFTNGDFQEDFVIFNGTGSAYFAFHVPPTMVDPINSGIVTIDDFSIDYAPACPNPSILTASNVLTNSATLGWKPGYSETKWEVAIQSPNSGVPTSSGTVVNIEPAYNATGLTSNTQYEYYVRALCGSDYSAWVGPFQFKTICNVLPTPFIETFETDSPTKSCWTIVNNNENANQWQLNMPVEPMFGTQMASLNCFTNGYNDDYLITPTLAVKPNQRLRFYYKSKYDPSYLEDLKVLISTQGVDISKFTTTIFDTGSNPITNLETKEMVINLTGITAASNINIAFYVPPFPPDPSGLRGSYLFIDNVIVEDIPACPAVYNVATNSIADKTTTIDWQATGAQTSWQISVQPFGTLAPAGNALPEYLKTANAHPYTITGLTPSTKYQYYVRPACGGAWVGPFDLLTKCDLSNVCKYTISLTTGNIGGATSIDVVQNGVVNQTLASPPVGPGQPTIFDYEVFLCSGIEFSLNWSGQGSGMQYPQSQAVVKDQNGTVVWTSPLGLGTINTNIFTGVANCNAITCPQPTNLAVNNIGVLSWTKGGSETQWEVFVQPLGQGSIPQSGVIVTSPSYTPVASDFALSPAAGTNEFFVRAICSSNDKSYWTGPKVFIRNDEPSTAIPLQVNSNGACTSQGTKASFIGATASATPTSCAGVNGGDIWYEFVATSKVHTVELSNFTPGSYYAISNTGAFPTIILSLYEVQANGSLAEKACSENNSLVTTYSSELTVGKTYKIRVKYNGTEINDKKFDICVSTTADISDMNAFNYSFEKEPMKDLTGILTIIHSKMVPGWRTNTDWGTIFLMEASNSPGVTPYEGSQCVQLTQDPANTWNPADPNIKGLYKDFETSSEVLKVKYSFASASRLSGNGTTLELWAGPPAGPFVKVTDHNATSLVWTLVKGIYDVLGGQPITRFIFRVKENTIGHLLDAADFKVNTDIITKDVTLIYNQTSTTVAAEGVGQWIADANNPAQTKIETPTSKKSASNTTASKTTTISGFNTPGAYTYYWKTRYSEKPFTVIAGSSLGTDDFKTGELTYYPNPVSDLLTITANEAITRVEVYNLLGQQIRVLDTNSANIQIDLNMYAPSTYLIKVYSENKTQIFKVIKK